MRVLFTLCLFAARSHALIPVRDSLVALQSADPEFTANPLPSKGDGISETEGNAPIQIPCDRGDVQAITMLVAEKLPKFECNSAWVQVTDEEDFTLVGKVDSNVFKCRVAKSWANFAPRVTLSGQLEAPPIDNQYSFEACDKIGDESEVLLQSHVDEINSRAMGWHAKLHFAHATRPLPAVAAQRLGARRLHPEELEHIPISPRPSAQELLQVANTDAFDHRGFLSAKGLTCNTWKILDQQQCGACYAFSANRVFNERLCRASNASHNIQLSEQDVVSCAEEGSFSMRSDSKGQNVLAKAGSWPAVDGCNGGSAVGVWLQMFSSGSGETGRVTRSSSLYSPAYSAKGKDSVPCQDSQKTGHPVYFTDKTSLYRIMSKDVGAIKSEILKSGPVSAAMEVYDDFMSYSGGVYRRTSTNMVGAHAVAILGWGSEAGQDYWLFANSWGGNWGEEGYGRIAMGNDEVGIESELIFVAPDLEKLPCKDSLPCQNGGSFNADCKCQCAGGGLFWTGPQCATCRLDSSTCLNGGTADTATCTCKCLDGFFGAQCKDYMLVQWWAAPDPASALQTAQRRLLSETKRKALLSWSLSDWQPGSYFVRYSASLDTQGTAEVDGSDVPLTANKGGLVIELQGDVNPYNGMMPPKNTWVYVLSLSRGTNEWGKSRGFTTTQMPPLVFDEAKQCYKGGYQPRKDAPILSPDRTCADSFPPRPPGGSYPPVPMLSTPAPTMGIIPIGKREINEATKKVADWVNNNVGHSASNLGKAFPVLVKSDLTPAQIISHAMESLFKGDSGAKATLKTEYEQKKAEAQQAAMDLTEANDELAACKANSSDCKRFEDVVEARTRAKGLADTDASRAKIKYDEAPEDASFDFMECKKYAFKDPPEPICRMILAYGTYIVIGGICGIVILLGSIVWLMLRFCCHTCGGDKPQGPYSSTDRLIHYILLLFFMVGILVGSGAGFAVVSMLPSTITTTTDAVTEAVGDLSTMSSRTMQANESLVATVNSAKTNLTTAMHTGVGSLDELQEQARLVAKKMTSADPQLSPTQAQALENVASVLKQNVIPKTSLDNLINLADIAYALDKALGPVVGPLNSISSTGANLQQKITSTRSDIEPIEGYGIMGMRILYALVWLIALVAVLGILCGSSSSLWLCFFIGMLWISVGFIGWGVFLPFGKLIDDICPMLPMLDGNGSETDKLLPMIFSDNNSSQDMQNVVKECLESRRGDLLLVYNVSRSDLMAAFEFDVSMNNAVKSFQGFDLDGNLSSLSTTVQTIKNDPGYNNFSNKEAIINLEGRLNDALGFRTPDNQTLKEFLAAFDINANKTFQAHIETLLSAGSDCKWAGEDFEAVHNGICNGIGGTVDIIWFTFLLTSIAMFFYCVVVAKTTKRVDDRGEDGDLRQPFLPDKSRSGGAPYAV